MIGLALFMLNNLLNEPRIVIHNFFNLIELDLFSSGI